jgi:hypothetical protein
MTNTITPPKKVSERITGEFMADHWLHKFARWVAPNPNATPETPTKEMLYKGKLHPLKTPINVDQYRVSLEEIEGPYLSPNQDKGPAAPEPTTHLFSVEALIINVSPKQEAITYGYDRFRLYDEKGYVFEALDTGKSQRKQPVLSNGVLSAGLWVRGWVTWELPIFIIPHRVQFYTGYLIGTSTDFLVKP